MESFVGTNRIVGSQAAPPNGRVRGLGRSKDIDEPLDGHSNSGTPNPKSPTAGLDRIGSCVLGLDQPRSCVEMWRAFMAWHGSFVNYRDNLLACYLRVLEPNNARKYGDGI